MIEVSNYDFKYISDKTVKPEEYFVNSYVDEYFEFKKAIKPIRRIGIMLDLKYKRLT